MAKLLTATGIEKTKPTEKRQEIADARQPGLYLIIQPSGQKSWAIRYRHPLTGKPRKMTLGRYPDFSLVDARDMASDALKKVARGIDPGIERAEQKAADIEAIQDESDLIENVIVRFIKRHSEVHSPKSAPETRRLLTNEFISQWEAGRFKTSIEGTLLNS